MLIEYTLSFILAGATATICSLTSGGIIWNIVNTSFFPGLLLILAIMIILAGHRKAFLRVLDGPKKFRNYGLKDLKDMELSLSFAFKSLLYICLFYLLISSIYFYLNFENTQTLGFNLAAVMYAVFNFAFFGLIMITIKGKLKAKTIAFMAEPEPSEKKPQRLTEKEIFLQVSKILICIALIAGVYLFIIYHDIRNESLSEPLSIYYMRDIPGLVYIFIPTFLLLTISGNFKNFFAALKISIRNEKISVTKKAISVNAVETLRLLFLLEGIMCAVCGYIGMLFYLEDRSMLGINFAVASVPLIYGLLFNLVMLPVESKLSRLAD